MFNSFYIKINLLFIYLFIFRSIVIAENENFTANEYNELDYDYNTSVIYIHQVNVLNTYQIIKFVMVNIVNLFVC